MIASGARSRPATEKGAGPRDADRPLGPEDAVADRHGADRHDYWTVSVTSSSTNEVCSDESSTPRNFTVTVWPM